MKKLFILKVIIIITIISILSILIVLNFSTEVVQNVDNEIVIEPEEEISEEQMRQTTIALYFEDKQSMELVKEEKKVDAKDLIDNPYMYIVNLLILGPEDETMQNPIPEGTKLNKAELNGDSVTVDLSNEFLNSSGTNAIYSIVNSLTELKEVNSVKILINGEEQDNMKEAFVRK